jgi:hypothetical protein
VLSGVVSVEFVGQFLDFVERLSVKGDRNVWVKLGLSVQDFYGCPEAIDVIVAVGRVAMLSFPLLELPSSLARPSSRAP